MSIDQLSAVLDDRLREIVRAELEACREDDRQLLFTIPQAAAKLGKSARSVYDRISAGDLQAVTDRGTLHVTAAALDAYVAGLPVMKSDGAMARTRRQKSRASSPARGW